MGHLLHSLFYLVSTPVFTLCLSPVLRCKLVLYT